MIEHTSLRAAARLRWPRDAMINSRRILHENAITAPDGYWFVFIFRNELYSCKLRVNSRAASRCIACRWLKALHEWGEMMRTPVWLLNFPTARDICIKYCTPLMHFYADWVFKLKGIRRCKLQVIAFLDRLTNQKKKFENETKAKPLVDGLLIGFFNVLIWMHFWRSQIKSSYDRRSASFGNSILNHLGRQISLHLWETRRTLRR